MASPQEIEAAKGFSHFQEMHRNGFRFAQKRSENSKWRPVPAVPAPQVVAWGFKLATPFRSTSALSEDEFAELLHLCALPGGEVTEEEVARKKELLRRCPYKGEMPPIDLDVSPGVPREDVVGAARRMDGACAEVGLGTPAWAETGGKGIHGDLLAPEGVEHGDLVRAFGVLVRRAAKLAGLPLLTDYREKKSRPPVVVDDSLFDRYPGSLGGVWRLIGSIHDKYQKPKRRIDVGPGVREEPGPADRAAVEAALKEVVDADADRKTRKERIERKTGERPARRPLPTIEEVSGGAPLRATAEAVKTVLPPPGQRHFVRLALAAWLLQSGVPDSAAAATLAVATEDPDDAHAAVHSTRERIAAKQPLMSFKSRQVKDHVRGDAVRRLREALDLDLKAAGVSPTRRAVVSRNGWTESQKFFLKCIMNEHENRPDLPRARKVAKLFRRLLRCGTVVNVVDCKNHGVQRILPAAVCESLYCPTCRPRRMKSIEDAICETWPAKVVVGRIDGEGDDVLARTLDAKARILDAMPKADRQATGLKGKPFRWIAGAGFVVVVMDVKDAALVRTFDSKPTMASRAEAAVIAARVYASIGETWESLARELDGISGVWPFWESKAKTTGANTEGRLLFPWPKKEEVRGRIVSEVRAGEDGEDPGACLVCKKPCLVELRHTEHGNCLAFNEDGRLYTSREAFEAADRMGMVLFRRTEKPQTG